MYMLGKRVIVYWLRKNGFDYINEVCAAELKVAIHYDDGIIVCNG